MGGSSGGGQNTTVTKSDPWAGQQPYLKTGFEQAQQQLNSSTPEYYQDSTVAPQSETTQQAMQLQAQRALSGSPVTDSAQNLATNTMNGNYLNSNPYLDANFAAGTDAITKAYNGAVNQNTAGAVGSGRYGSGMQMFANGQAQDTLAKNLNNLYGQTYYNNYNTERGNQQAMAGQAAGIAGSDYTDLGKLSDVGSAQDQYSQAVTDADVNKWNYNQNLPANKLGQYMGLIQGNYGGSSSTQTPLSGQSLMGSLLGAGMTGLGAYSAMR